jgi:hypothetical protein
VSVNLDTGKVSRCLEELALLASLLHATTDSVFSPSLMRRSLPPRSSATAALTAPGAWSLSPPAVRSNWGCSRFGPSSKCPHHSYPPRHPPHSVLPRVN